MRTSSDSCAEPKKQIVGWSCDSSGNCRAYLWQSHKMVDLNTLISPDSPLYLVLAFGINDDGDIVGQAVENSTGDLHAFLARPISTQIPSQNLGEPAAGEAPMALPGNVRELLRKHLPIQPGTLEP